MNLTNIIIIVIILIIIYFVLTKVILKSNILYDDILDASEEPDYNSKPSGSGFFTSNKKVTKNEIPNNVMSDNFTSNFMISVWFYVDNWSTTQTLKNILYIANSEGSLPLSIPNFTGISEISCNTINSDIQRFSLILDQYDNNLFIDIASMENNKDCTSTAGTSTPGTSTPGTSTAGPDIYTRYKIENIPIQKWNCLTISVDTLILDVYLDGKLINSFILPSTFDPGNEKNNIYLGNNPKSSGFQGFITRVRYEPNSINTQEALNIYKAGINKSLLKSLFNRYSLKVSFLEYNKEKGSFSI